MYLEKEYGSRVTRAFEGKIFFNRDASGKEIPMQRKQYGGYIYRGPLADGMENLRQAMVRDSFVLLGNILLDVMNPVSARLERADTEEQKKAVWNVFRRQTETLRGRMQMLLNDGVASVPSQDLTSHIELLNTAQSSGHPEPDKKHE